MRDTIQTPSGCEWFAGCRNVATGTTAHPALGDVPTCDRCHRFASVRRADTPEVTDAPR